MMKGSGGFMVWGLGYGVKVKILLLSIFISYYILYPGPYTLSYAEPGRASFTQVERLFLEGSYDKVIAETEGLMASGPRWKDEL